MPERISKIYGLVHPEYYFTFFNRATALYPKWRYLNLAWNSKGVTAINDPRSLWLHYSVLSYRNLREVLRNPHSFMDSEEWDVRRVATLAVGLGPRLFAYPYSENPGRFDERADVESRGFTYDPANTEGYFFGELLESSVPFIGLAAIRKLGLSLENCYILPELCLATEDTRRINT
ncbi:hypothetical protein HYS91_02275 [Candidatus Daviesbacteria bacterium]|nr:hypothetical protein [Candidatus Daviesbacteria bacterium]